MDQDDAPKSSADQEGGQPPTKVLDRWDWLLDATAGLPTASQVRVLGLLVRVDHAPDRLVHLGNPFLMRYLGLSKNTIRSALAGLVDAGLLELVSKGHGRGNADAYRVLYKRVGQSDPFSESEKGQPNPLKGSTEGAKRVNQSDPLVSSEIRLGRTPPTPPRGGAPVEGKLVTRKPQRRDSRSRHERRQDQIAEAIEELPSVKGAG